MINKNLLAFSPTIRLQFILLTTALAIAAPAYAADTYQVQGKKGANNTCNFSTSLTLAPGETAIEERQVGFNPATCTIKMQRSTPDFAQDSDPKFETKSGIPAEPSAPTGSLVAPAALRSTRAYSRTFLVNRNGVFQSHVKDGVSYTYNGSRVSGSCPTFRDQFKWNTNFWSLLSRGTTRCQYNFNQSTITSSTGGRFGSPAGFYCGVRTETFYNRHTTVGRANGTIVDNANFGGSFGCLSQIFIRRQIVRF